MSFDDVFSDDEIYAIGKKLIEQGEWRRYDYDGKYSLIALRLPYDADLSSNASRVDAINRNDMEKSQGESNPLNALVSDNRRWKSVDEALPEEREHVLCFVEYPNNDRGVFFRVGWLKYAAGDKDCPYFVIPHRRSPETNKYPEFKVTHWQELPDKPQTPE